MIGTAGRILFLSIMALFLAAPLIVVTGVSFNASPRMSFPPEHPALVWYGVFFRDEAWRSAFGLSLIIAALAALVAVSIAFPIAYAIWKYRSPLAIALEGL